MRFQRASVDRSAAFRRPAFSLMKVFSIGFEIRCPEIDFKQLGSDLNYLVGSALSKPYRVVYDVVVAGITVVAVAGTVRVEGALCRDGRRLCYAG